MNDQNVQPTNTSTSVVSTDGTKQTGRKWAVGLLITLGVILITLANVAFWAYFTILNTNGWVAAVGPLSKDPAIAGMVSKYVVGQVFEGAGIDQTIEEALPAELQLFTGPLVVGIEQLADQAVTAVVMSDAFNNVWVGVNRVGHTVIMEVLKGGGDRLYFQDGNLTLDLNDVYNFLQDNLGISKDLNLIPQAQEGRLVLFSSRQVAILQELVSYLTTLGLLLPLLTILVFGAAVWVSLWRRQTVMWTVMWIGSVVAVAMLISLIVFSGTRSAVLVSIPNPFLRELGRTILNVLTQGLMVQTIFFMIVGIALLIGGWQAAPDSALMRWEASRKEKKSQKAAEQVPEETVA